MHVIKAHAMFQSAILSLITSPPKALRISGLTTQRPNKCNKSLMKPQLYQSTNNHVLVVQFSQMPLDYYYDLLPSSTIIPIIITIAITLQRHNNITPGNFSRTMITFIIMTATVCKVLLHCFYSGSQSPWSPTAGYDLSPWLPGPVPCRYYSGHR